MIYRADFADDNFEIIRCDTDEDALREAWNLEQEHGQLFNLSEIDENYDEIRIVI